MYKHNLFISKLAFFLCFFTLLGGCNNQADAPKVSQVVSKKIVAKKQVVSKPAAPIKVAPPKKQAAPKLEPKIAKIIVPVPVAPLTPATAKPAAVASQKKEVQAALTPTGETGTSAPQAIIMKPVASAINYDFTNKFDPFMPLYKDEPVVKTKAKKKKRRLPLTPLEKVDLSQLKLVGIIRAPSGDKALVQESSGKGYIVKKGTYIGIHAGRVINVLKDKIIVEEEVETALGTYKLQERELKIHKPAGEL